MFKLPELKYEALTENHFLSEETIDFHVYKHHQGYINNLNKLIEEKDEYRNLSIIELINKSENAIFNNAAQAWNHSFYWNCTIKDSSTEIPKELLMGIENDFVSFENFIIKFKEKCMSNFGSGWTWLIKDKTTGKLEIINTQNAINPIKISNNYIPVLVCDIWEHAYYIDHSNNRAKYVDAFIKNINWNWVFHCYQCDYVQEILKK